MASSDQPLTYQQLSLQAQYQGNVVKCFVEDVIALRSVLCRGESGKGSLWLLHNHPVKTVELVGWISTLAFQPVNKDHPDSALRVCITLDDGDGRTVLPVASTLPFTLVPKASSFHARSQTAAPEPLHPHSDGGGDNPMPSRSPSKPSNKYIPLVQRGGPAHAIGIRPSGYPIPPQTHTDKGKSREVEMVKQHVFPEYKVGDVVRVRGRVKEWFRGGGRCVREVDVVASEGGSIQKVPHLTQATHAAVVHALHGTLYSQPFQPYDLTGLPYSAAIEHRTPKKQVGLTKEMEALVESSGGTLKSGRGSSEDGGSPMLVETRIPRLKLYKHPAHLHRHERTETMFASYVRNWMMVHTQDALANAAARYGEGQRRELGRKGWRRLGLEEMFKELRGGVMADEAKVGNRAGQKGGVWSNGYEFGASKPEGNMDDTPKGKAWPRERSRTGLLDLGVNEARTPTQHRPPSRMSIGLAPQDASDSDDEGDEPSFQLGFTLTQLLAVPRLHFFALRIHSKAARDRLTHDPSSAFVDPAPYRSADEAAWRQWKVRAREKRRKKMRGLMRSVLREMGSWGEVVEVDLGEERGRSEEADRSKARKARREMRRAREDGRLDAGLTIMRGGDSFISRASSSRLSKKKVLEDDSGSSASSSDDYAPIVRLDTVAYLPLPTPLLAPFILQILHLERTARSRRFIPKADSRRNNGLTEGEILERLRRMGEGGRWERLGEVAVDEGLRWLVEGGRINSWGKGWWIA